MGCQRDEDGMDGQGSSGGPYQHENQSRHRSGATQIECAPCNVAHAADRHDPRVDDVNQRHVDVINVAIRDRAHSHLLGDEVENCRVTDQGPVQRMPQQYGDGYRQWDIHDRDKVGFGAQRRIQGVPTLPRAAAHSRDLNFIGDQSNRSNRSSIKHHAVS